MFNCIAIFKIVPESDYNTRLPILFVKKKKSASLILRKEYGSRNQQDVDVHALFYFAFRCLTLEKRQLHWNLNQLAFLKVAVEK